MNFIDVAAGIFTLLVLIGLFTGISRFWSLLTQGINGAPSLLSAFKSYLMPVLSKILRHEKFNDCEANKIRYYAHLAIFYGFVLSSSPPQSVRVVYGQRNCFQRQRILFASVVTF